MKKLNVDCYYFYHSKCMKGDSCAYRHAEAALGNEQVCPEWAKGGCNNYQCPLRHTKAGLPRSQTRCYWENTPSGCLKNNCPFMHTGMKATNGGGGQPSGQSSNSSNPNLHVVVSLADSEESEDEHDVQSSKQTNEAGAPTSSRTVMTTVAHVGNNRRVVLPTKSSSSANSQESSFDTGIQTIGVLSGGRVMKTNLSGGDLRRVLGGSQQASAQQKPQTQHRLDEKSPNSGKPEDQDRRQTRMKRFSAEEEGIMAKQAKKEESRDSVTSSEKPENESSTGNANQSPRNTQNSLVLDEDELLGDMSAGNLEHLNGDDLISSV